MEGEVETLSSNMNRWKRMVDQGVAWEGGTEGIKYFPGLASAARGPARIR